MNPSFSLPLFVAMGLAKNYYFEALESAQPHIFAYKGYPIRRGKPGGSMPFYVPEKFNFILTPSEKHPGLFHMKRRDIQRLRKNNPIKRNYLIFRSSTFIEWQGKVYDDEYREKHH